MKVVWICLALFGVVGFLSPAAVLHRAVLATYKVGPQGNLAYEVSIAPCREAACPFQVQLLEGGSVIATLGLDWMKAYGPAAKDYADESSGVGDPLGTTKKIIAWSTGEEKDNVSTVVRVVRLTSGLNGVLIDRVAGFDVLKRRHDLVVAVDKKLILAWSDQDGAGPTWSTVVVTDPGEAQEILAFDGFRQPSDTLPDRLHISAYQWDAHANKLDNATSGIRPIYALIAGEFKSATEAHTALKRSNCLNGFWVLKSDVLLNLEPGRFVLAAVSSKKQLAEEKSTAVKGCSPKLPVSMIESEYSPLEAIH